MVIVATAFFHAQFFGKSDLNIFDVLTIPRGFKERIRQTHGQNILDHFFAQIVVDPENILFREHFCDFIVQFFG